MRKITWALITVLLLGIKTIKAQEQTLSASEPISSGCLSQTRGTEAPIFPTIKLTKEGDILSVDLLNYSSNCGTRDFEVENRLYDGNSDNPSVVISVTPVIPAEADCICPFNISYTVRGLEKNSFYLTCWWYDGPVELTEGEPLVLEYEIIYTVLDGLTYRLLKTTHQAQLIYQGKWNNKVERLQIPSEIEYGELKYTVTSIDESVFSSNTNIKEIIIPKTVKNTEFGSLEGITSNPFSGCLSLETIEVEEGNPAICSVDGVLFNKDKTNLLCYPTASPRELYTVPDGVKRVATGAFFNNQHLRKIVLPDNLESLGYSVFANSKSLEEVVLPSNIKELPFSLFKNCIKLKDIYYHSKTVPITGADVFGGVDLSQITLHVPAKSIDSYKSSIPWNQFGAIVPLETQTYKIEINEKNFPDSNFRNWVLSQDYGADGVLTNEELENITTLDISRLDIHNQKGIEYFTALKVLICRTNRLTSLDLSKNTALERLECVGNMMTTINLQKNQKMRYLNCGVNKLTELDISGCSELDTLACSGNQLTELNVSINTKLICLECYGNQLTSLDLSKNTALRRLHCNNNQLTTLDLSKNRALSFLECSNNLLTTLDVTGNSILKTLNCMDNKLTALCVSNNKSVKKIYCFNNLMTTFDASGCSALEVLSCNNNQLTTLCLSGCSALKELYCTGNQLTSLDLSENTALTALFCYQNRIKGTEIDVLVESLPTVTKSNLNIMNIANEQNVMTTTQVAAAKAKGWTPYIWMLDHSMEYVGIETALADYRPFVEEGKVWKVGTISGNPVQVVDYYYFDGDTIINGKTCKQMMCQRYISLDYLDDDYLSQEPSLSKVGAWYEEDKKVYFYNLQMEKDYWLIKYDFSLDAYTFQYLDTYPVLIGLRQAGGIKGFKGVYRDVMIDLDTKSTIWLEGVGDIDGPVRNPYDSILGDPIPEFLMSCTVGDEVIYLNDEYEDGATPAEARKRRFDFSHTIKTKPKARRQSGEEQSLYGEYNDQQLGINLDPLVDAYQVRITDESGKLVYEKAVNAGSIVGLNIDISAYAKGRYTVTVENSQESFTGQFETQATGIEELKNSRIEKSKSIYNLQGQRLNSLQKGLNIVNGRKLLIP